jgi:ribosomal protein S18 acetylase RimI-like enzyme
LNLADRVDAVHAEFRRRSALALDGEVCDDDGVLLWAGPNESAIVVNGALRTSSDVAAEDVFERAATFFGERSRGHTMFCRSDTDADLVDVCRERHLPPLAEGGLPEMVLHGRPLVPPLPAGASVRKVSTDRDRGDYIGVFSGSYAQLGASEDTVFGVMPPLEMLQRDDVGAFVVELDGTPAAVAMSVLIDGVSDIHWVGTLPIAARRGLGETATATAIDHGFSHGAEIAALQASPMGEGLYRRMGFVELYRYEEYLVFAT